MPTTPTSRPSVTVCEFQQSGPATPCSIRLSARSSTVCRPRRPWAFSAVGRLRRPRAGVISRTNGSPNRAANRTATSGTRRVDTGAPARRGLPARCARAARGPAAVVRRGRPLPVAQVRRGGGHPRGHEQRPRRRVLRTLRRGHRGAAHRRGRRRLPQGRTRPRGRAPPAQRAVGHRPRPRGRGEDGADPRPHRRRTARPAPAVARQGPARGQAPRTSSIATGRCSCSDSVQASAIQPASRASATVQGEGRVLATTSVNAVSSAR